MSDNIRLVIEISKKDYEWAKQIAQTRNESVYCERQIISISNGIPLDDVLDILDNIGKESEDKNNC